MMKDLHGELKDLLREVSSGGDTIEAEGKLHDILDQHVITVNQYIETEFKRLKRNITSVFEERIVEGAIDDFVNDITLEELD